MHLTKNYPDTELKAFVKKFKGKSFDVSANANGNIIKVITTDKTIIAYVKKLGLD